MSKSVTLTPEEAQALHVLFAQGHLKTIAMLRGLTESTTATLTNLGEKVKQSIITEDGSRSQCLLVVPLDETMMECLEVKMLFDPDEIIVLRHGSGRSDEGEAVYSELIDDPDPRRHM